MAMDRKEWLEKQLFTFKGDLLKAQQETLEKWCADYLPFLESEYDSNVCFNVHRELTAFLEGISEDHWCRKLTLAYSGEEIRAKILAENKEQLIACLNQDSLKQIETLKNELKFYHNRTY